MGLRIIRITLLRMLIWFHIIKKIIQVHILNRNMDRMFSNYVKFWGVLKDVFIDGYLDHGKYSVFSYPGIYVFSLLFADIDEKTSLSDSVNYRGILAKLKDDADKNPLFAFRNPLNIELWRYDGGDKMFITRNQQILDYVYNVFRKKLFA